MRYDDVARDFFALAGIPREAPGLALLEKLSRNFGRLPYENLTKIIRASEHADSASRMRMPDIVLADHIDLGAGGTCFSLTFFFEQVLRFAGFDCFPVFCDRSYGPATHCALIVRLPDGARLVDPGYLFDAPLVVPPRGESVQRAASGIVRLVRLGETSQLLLYTERDGKRKLRYRLRDAPVSPADFERRWIESFDWAMMRHMCVSQIVDGAQLYVRDGMMRNIGRSGQSQERLGGEFASAVEKTFQIDPRLVDAASDYLAQNAEKYRLERRGDLCSMCRQSPSSE